MTRRVGAALAALVVLSAAACSSASGGGGASRFADPARPAPLRATDPYLVMTGPSAGWAVWRTGKVWLLLRTTDGFTHVANRTPVAVPTDGGLVGAFTSSEVGLAVLTTERLTRSPVLTGSSPTPSWVPQQLPQAVSDAVGALSVGPGPVSAVTTAANGTLVVLLGGRWVRRTDGRTLSPSGDLRIDAVVWADARTGLLTGHGRAGTQPVFVTHDAGLTWRPVPITSATSVAALAPCGSGHAWFLPVLDAGGTVTVYGTRDGGATWQKGAAVPQPRGAPAWGCSGAVVWVASATSKGDALEVSTDAGRTWTRRGVLPGDLTSLVPTSSGDGVAATGGAHSRIFKVSDGGWRFTARVLPPWVAALGEQMSDS